MKNKYFKVLASVVIISICCVVHIEGKSGSCLKPTGKKTYGLQTLDGTRVRCSLCSPGEYLVEECSAKTETRCAPCSPGHYLSVPNKCRSCQRCDSCHSYNGLMTIQRCTATTPSRCECFPGMEHVTRDRCEKKRPKCPKGKFRQGAICVLHSVCTRGEEAWKRGTSVSDTVCRRCPENTFNRRASAKARCKPQPICIGPPKKPGNRKRKVMCSEYMTERHAPTTTGTAGNSSDIGGIGPEIPQLWLETTHSGTSTKRPALEIKANPDNTTPPMVPTTISTKMSTLPQEEVSGTGTASPQDSSEPTIPISNGKKTTQFIYVTPLISQVHRYILDRWTSNVIIIGFIVFGTFLIIAFLAIVCLYKKLQDKNKPSPVDRPETIGLVPMPQTQDHTYSTVNDRRDHVSTNQESHSASSSDPVPGGVRQTEAFVHTNGNVHTRVAPSSADSVYWDNAKQLPGTSIPPSAELLKNERPVLRKPKGFKTPEFKRKDSTSSSPDDSPRRRQPANVPSHVQHTFPSAGMANGYHSMDSSIPPRVAPQSNHQGAGTTTSHRPETRAVGHRSRFVPSGNQTASESEQVIKTLGVIVAENDSSESGLADTTSTGTVSETSQDAASSESQSDSQNNAFLDEVVSTSTNGSHNGVGGAHVAVVGNPKQQYNVHCNGNLGASSDSLHSMDDTLTDTSTLTRATPEKVAGIDRKGASLDVTNGSNTETAALREGSLPVISGTGDDGLEEENNQPTYQLADGIQFESIAQTLSEGIDIWTYQSFLTHLDVGGSYSNISSTKFQRNVQKVLLQWWQSQEHPSIEPILNALKKSGNERLRQEIISRYCKLD